MGFYLSGAVQDTDDKLEGRRERVKKADQALRGMEKEHISPESITMRMAKITDDYADLVTEHIESAFKCGLDGNVVKISEEVRTLCCLYKELMLKKEFINKTYNTYMTRKLTIIYWLCIIVSSVALVVTVMSLTK